MVKQIFLTLLLALSLTVLLTGCGYKAGPEPLDGPVEKVNKPPESRDY